MDSKLMVSTMDSVPMSTLTSSSLLDCPSWSILWTNSISTCGKSGDVASADIFSITEDCSTQLQGEAMSVSLQVGLEKALLAFSAVVLCVRVSVLLPAFLQFLPSFSFSLRKFPLLLVFFLALGLHCKLTKLG